MKAPGKSPFSLPMGFAEMQRLVSVRWNTTWPVRERSQKKFFIKSGDSLLAAAERKEPHSTFVYNYVRRCSVYIQAHFVLERLVGLFEKDKEAGSIARESLFSKTTILKFPTNFMLPSAVFLFWLVLLSRRRRSRMRH